MRHEITLKQLDINDEKGTLIEYAFAEGDFVKIGDTVLCCETAKAITDIPSEVEGYVLYHFEEGSEAPLHSVIVSVFDDLSELNAFQKETQMEAPQPTATPKATKKAVKLAAELGISLDDMTKKAGLIKEADVKAYAEAQNGIPATVPAPRPQSSPASCFRYDHERVAIIGAGKGAEVLIDILLDDYDKTVAVLVDDKVRSFTAFGRDYPVSQLGIYEFADAQDKGLFDTAIISISANLRSMQFRGRIYDYYVERGIPFTNVIAKSADIRRGVQLGKGNIIGANSYIGAQTVIGNNNLISYCAVVGHHNVIGDTNLLAPAMATSGSVKIGSNCIIPAGVNFINGVSIGNNVIFPVGYDVSTDIEDSRHIKDRR